MKKTYLYIIVVLLAVALQSCKKNGTQIIDTPLGSTAQIKYFNFGTGAPSVNFYANSTKVSAIASATGTESTAGTASGGVFPASNYSIIDPASYTFKAQIPSTATTDANLAISTLTGSVDVGKYYTLYLGGIYNTTTKVTDAFMLEDVIPTADYATTYVRLVNAVSNGSAPFSLYLKNTVTTTESLVATNVAYKAGSAFVAVPPGSYELYIRYATAPTVNVISRNGTSAVSFVAGKVYTIGARGDMTVTSTTLATRPQLDNTANR